jgi:outer membrane autotransporter protein
MVEDLGGLGGYGWQRYGRHAPTTRARDVRRHRGQGWRDTIYGVPIARDAAVLELGVDMAVSRHTTVGVSYNGEFVAGSQLNAGMLDVKYRF